jgi:hypothetical protein
MDTFITIEAWNDQTGAWHRLDVEPRNLTQASQLVRSYPAMDTYRILSTKVEAIWESGDEIAPTEKLRHRGCSL